MDSRLRNAAILFFVITVGAFWSRHTGWYSEYWFTDVILHLLAGAAFAYTYLWLARNGSEKSRWLMMLNVVAFAAFCSVLWEFWEYWGHFIMPAKAHFYIPELGDTLEDIGCGMLGAAVISFRSFLSTYRTYSRKV